MKKQHTSWYFEAEVMDAIKMLLIQKKKWKKLNDFISEAVREKLERERQQ